jgi:hypothetical protein
VADQQSTSRTRRAAPIMPTPAMLTAAREEEDGWGWMPAPSMRYVLLWQAMLKAWEEEAANVR